MPLNGGMRRSDTPLSGGDSVRVGDALAAHAVAISLAAGSTGGRLQTVGLGVEYRLLGWLESYLYAISCMLSIARLLGHRGAGARFCWGRGWASRLPVHICDQWRGRRVPARPHRNGHGAPTVHPRSASLAARRRGVTPCLSGLAGAGASVPPPLFFCYNGTLNKPLLHCAAFYNLSAY